jgi:CTP:molybdopterin cytidylyltransferase MocA
VRTPEEAADEAGRIRRVPAVVTAGDSRAAKAIYGRSKVYLEVAGLPLVAHVVRTLQACDEIESVWVVGDAERLAAALGQPALQSTLRKPLYVVEQKRDLISNCWETYRRILSGDPAQGRDPENEADRDQEVLFLSGDLPLATPQEISTLIRRAQADGADYALGLCPAESLEVFRPAASGETGIEVAYFNSRDGRFRQNNLHYARPGRIGRLERIEEMYEMRHQRRFWNMFTLTLRLLLSRVGGLKIAVLFGCMHLAGLADRSGRPRLARLLARFVTLEINRATIGKILDTRFALVVTESAGCALDVDTEEEYDVVRERYDQWIVEQRARSEKLHGAMTSRDLRQAPPLSTASGPSGTDGSKG